MVTREALECCKLTLMGDSVQSSKEQNVNRNANSKDQVQDILVGNKNTIIRQANDHVCYALAKN